MEIASIKNESERLTITLSRRFILIRLTMVALFCALCLSVLALILFSNGGTSLFALVKAQPMLLVLVFPTIMLLIFTVQIALTFYCGDDFSVDRQSDSIRHNSHRLAALSDLKEVQVRRPTSSTWKGQRTSPGSSLGPILPVPEKLKSIPEHLRIWEWPSVWLVLNNQKPIRILDTTHLMPIRVWLFEVKLASQQEVKKDVITVATEIADYAGVTLYNETAGI